MSTDLFSINNLPIETNIGINSKINCKFTFLEKDENARVINLHLLNDVVFGGENLFYPNILSYSKYDKKYYNLINEKTMSLNDNLMIDNISIDINSKEKYDNPVFFFVYNTDNYYHFIYDTLPYLISFLKLKKEIKELKLLVNYPNVNVKNFYKFITEFLQIIGVENEDIILIKNNVSYKKVYVSSSYTHEFDSNLPPRKEVYDFFKEIVNKVKSKFVFNTPKRIYISRRSWLHNDSSNIGTNYTLRRKMVNENELVTLLQKKGYSEIFTEKLSTVEKLNFFFNSSDIVGAIGGGVCNVLFCETYTKLLTIVSPTFLDVNYRFKYSLDHVNNTYFFDTSHTEKKDFKIGMRVKCNLSGKIGEIVEVEPSKIKIIYSDSKVSGWNSESKFNTMYLNTDLCEKLDNGLNSSFEVDIKKFEKLLF